MASGKKWLRRAESKLHRRAERESIDRGYSRPGTNVNGYPSLTASATRHLPLDVWADWQPDPIEDVERHLLNEELCTPDLDDELALLDWDDD